MTWGHRCYFLMSVLAWLSFPRKGAEWSLVIQTLVRPQRTPHPCCLFGGCVSISFLLCTLTYLWILWIIKQGSGGLAAWCGRSNQGSQLATSCLWRGTASECQCELRNRNMGPLKWEEENPWCIPVKPPDPSAGINPRCCFHLKKPLLLHLKNKSEMLTPWKMLLDFYETICCLFPLIAIPPVIS